MTYSSDEMSSSGPVCAFADGSVCSRSLGPQVAQLAQANGVDVDDNKPYAELW